LKKPLFVRVVHRGLEVESFADFWEHLLALGNQCANQCVGLGGCSINPLPRDMQDFAVFGQGERRRWAEIKEPFQQAFHNSIARSLNRVANPVALAIHRPIHWLSWRVEHPHDIGRVGRVCGLLLRYCPVEGPAIEPPALGFKVSYVRMRPAHGEAANIVVGTLRHVFWRHRAPRKRGHGTNDKSQSHTSSCLILRK
jgi:hypothetical protein